MQEAVAEFVDHQKVGLDDEARSGGQPLLGDHSAPGADEVVGWSSLSREPRKVAPLCALEVVLEPAAMLVERRSQPRVQSNALSPYTLGSEIVLRERTCILIGH